VRPLSKPETQGFKHGDGESIMANETSKVIYADGKIEITHDLDRSDFNILYVASGKTFAVPDRATLAALGPNAIEACRRAGSDPDTKLVPNGWPCILPCEVRSAWTLAQRDGEKEMKRRAIEAEAAMGPELVAALDRFGSSDRAYEAEAMREYAILHKAGY
jgi:hypothetical protein